jgi:hypothetical protein
MLSRDGPEWRKSDGPEVHGDRVKASTSADLPGDTTVPVWALLSIVLGLIALTGSISAMCIAGTVALLGWMAGEAGDEKPPAGRGSDGPFGGAGLWP